MMAAKEHLSEIDLNEFLDGELTPVEVRRVEAHLESCADCSERMQALKQVFGALQTVRERELKVDLTGRIMSRVQPRWSWPRWALAMEGFLAVYLVMAVKPWESDWAQFIPDLLYRAAALVPEFDPRAVSAWVSGQWQRLGGGGAFDLRLPEMPLQSWLILMGCLFVAWLAGNGLLLKKNDNKPINGR